MVKGLGLFKEHFKGFSDQYVLIGGTACSLAMEDVGLEFRATKDLDIVLIVEALNGAFVAAFWEFIRNGRYQVQEKSSGEKQFYRFQKPEDSAFPAMLELFSRKPDALTLHGEGSGLTPIPVDEEVSSLSAILMNEDYYHFLHKGKRDIGGVPIVSEEYLIPLKMHAWLDLNSKLASGEQVDSKNINKHKNDVFRLIQIVDPEHILDLPESIRSDVKEFIRNMEAGEAIDLKNLGVKKITLADIFALLKKIYG
jgi:hypothetical protein